MTSSQQSLLFLTKEQPNRIALREFCHGRCITRMVVLRPSVHTDRKYACYAVKSPGRRFVNYDRTTIARKLRLRRPDSIILFGGGRESTHRHLFYCLVDTSSKLNLDKRLYFTHGIYPNNILTAVMNDAVRAQITVSESHHHLLDRMLAATPKGCSIVRDAIASVIRQGELPDLRTISLYDSSEDNE